MKKLKNINWYMILAYIYIVLPFVIFVIGWLKWYWSIPMAILVILCFIRACKEAPNLWKPKWDKDTIVKGLFIVGIISLWVYYSGIGMFVFQNTDHLYRNSIFNVLVDYNWPVINMEVISNQFPNASATGLIYYIGYWLPSALVGKIFGLRMGYYAQAAWAILGIVLVYYFICCISKKLEVWPLVILILFSGLDILGYYLTGTDFREISSTLHLEWWDTPYQFSSMTSQLFWVFNQAIPAWLCTMMIYVQKNNRSIIFILACSMLTSTFPFVGLLLLSLFFIFNRKYKVDPIKKLGDMKKIKAYFKCLVKDTCTLQNVIGGGIVGITSFLYLISNSSAGRVMGENVKGPDWNPSLAKWIIFIIIEIGIYVIIIYKYQKDNGLFYYTVANLCILSLFRVGYTNDFCMRTTIPALLILILMIIETIRNAWHKKEFQIVIPLVLALAIGGITPLHEFTRTVTETYARIKDDVAVYEESVEEVDLLNTSNFAGDVDDNLFFKYFVKYQ